MNLIKNLPGYIAYTRKAIIQVIGLAGALLALGLLPAKYSAIVAVVIAVLTTVLHYLTPNSDSPVVDSPAIVVPPLPVVPDIGKHEAPEI